MATQINSRGIPVKDSITLGAVVPVDIAETVKDLADRLDCSTSQILRYALAHAFANSFTAKQVQQLTHVWTVNDKKEVLRKAAEARARGAEMSRLRRQIDAAKTRLRELESERVDD